LANIYFFEPLILFDERCYATVEGKVIWNCENFLRMLEKDIILDEADFRPTPSNNESCISLAGWLFDVSSTINHNATCEQIIKGWGLINNKDHKFVLDRLFQPIFRQLILSAKHTSLYDFRRSEPIIIELLRLAYWYYKCYTHSNSFEDISPSKRKEIRDKLFGTLLMKIEDYKTVIKLEGEYPEEREVFLKKLNENIKSASIAKKLDDDHAKFTKELLTALWSVNSELTFAGLISEQGNRLRFEKAYDFVLRDIPCQVKTFLPEEEENLKITQRISDRTKELWQGKNVEEAEANTEVNSLLKEKHRVIDHAIRQGGKIICINGTYSYAGYLLNRWASDNSRTDLGIEDAFIASIKLLESGDCNKLMNAEEKFVALIFGAAAIDVNFRFSALAYRIPVNLALDEKRLNLIERIQVKSKQ
jgi:hypothetical protein